VPNPRIDLSELRGLAASQNDHFLASEAVALGIGHDDLMRQSRENGPLERLSRGVYAFRDRERNFRGRSRAAILIAGPGAVAVKRTSQRLRQMDGAEPRDPVDIYHPWARRRSKFFVRSRALVLPEQVEVVHGIPCSDEVTTLAQLGAVVDAERLERAVEWYLRKHGPAGWDRLAARLGVRGSSGLLALREVLELRRRDLPATHSELETRYWQLLRSSKLIAENDMPKRQVPIRDPRTGDPRFFLDNAWMDLLLYAELDGVAAHTAERAVYVDRWRLNELTATLGLRALHYTWRDVVDHPKDVIRTTAAAIETARRTLVRSGSSHNSAR
jgi:hypothetical protein